MTSTAAKIQLGQFDDRPVVRTRIAITRARDGLSEAMKVDPQIMHMDEEIFVVLKCHVAKVRFENDDPKDPGDVCRVHTLAADEATIVDGSLVADSLAEQRARIEEAKGIQHLDFDGDSDSDTE